MTGPERAPAPQTPQTRPLWSGWSFSMAGPAHVKAGRGNQDFALRSFLGGEGDFIAVADGLGSRPLSHAGARAACWAAEHAARFQAGNPQADVEATLRFLHAWWICLISPGSPEDCASTCVFAVRRAGLVTVAQIGDGLAVVLRRGGAPPLLVAPDKSESFANVTTCLGAAHRLRDWRVAHLPEAEAEAVLLCTDGISDDLAPESVESFARHVVAHHGGLSPADRAAELRRWLTDWPVRGHSDDKSLACLHVPEAAS